MKSTREFHRLDEGRYRLTLVELGTILESTAFAAIATNLLAN